MKKQSPGLALFFILSIPAAVIGIFLIYYSHLKREAVLSACSQIDFLKTFPSIMTGGEHQTVPAFHHDPSFKANNFSGNISCDYYMGDSTLREYTVTVTEYGKTVYSVSALTDSMEIK